MDKKSVLHKILGSHNSDREEAENAMREKRNNQPEFNFQPSTLAITQEFYERYEKISRILDDHPEIIDRAHKDLEEILRRQEENDGGRRCPFTTDTIVRTIIAQIIEGESLRGIVVRIDDSHYLRRFIRIYGAEMMDFTTLCGFKNAIKPQTWKEINELLRTAAIEEGLISGERLRVDMTAYETNIRWPTDSGLLWDTYRVLARLIDSARDIDPDVAFGKRLQRKKVKRLHSKIARRSGKKGIVSKSAKVAYKQLLGHVDGILDWVGSVCEYLRLWCKAEVPEFLDGAIRNLIRQIEYYRLLGARVVDQARRRVLRGEKVPNDEKIFSIFEPHTELLMRGKAGKPIEFGHMVALQQVEGCFITDYDVFEKRPVDYALVEPALECHRKAFGENPREFSADKGFYESREQIEKLEKEIEVVSIAKKGSRTEEETARETSRAFRLAQKFRAGIEGSISVLKRALRLCRCLNKGWEHYAATVGATIFAHNLLNLAKAYG